MNSYERSINKDSKLVPYVIIVENNSYFGILQILKKEKKKVGKRINWSFYITHCWNQMLSNLEQLFSIVYKEKKLILLEDLFQKV